MNIEETNQTPPRHEPDYSTGGPKTQRSGEDRPDRRRGPQGGDPGSGASSSRPPEGRREGGGRRGGPSDRGERGDRPGSGPRRGGERDERRDRTGGRGGDRRRSPESGTHAPAVAAEAPKPAAAPAAASSTLFEDLGGDLLASVSRSFSLTIRLLPEALREPISLGYLLARAQDTVADTPGIAAATRLEHLRVLLEMVKYGPDPEVLKTLQRDLVGKQKHDGERELLKQLDRCLAWLESTPVEDRWELRRTLARIGRAQELDLMRFGDATAAAPAALANGAELDEYTYLIAGSVGELWTRLCQRHLEAGWTKKSEGEMLAFGRRFGQGLQMVNILRDLPEDLANGRCYLPADLLAGAGIEPADLKTRPESARRLLDGMRLQAVEHLDEGWKYVRALTPYKLRYACALPILIGLETLGLLARTSPLEAGERLKISRSSVRGLMASAAVGTALSPWLSNLHSRLRKRAL